MEETRKDYLLRIYNEARVLGLCRKQKEFAELLGMHPSTLSNAMGGEEKYLTDILIRRVQAWEKQVLEPRRAAQPQQSQQRPDIVIPAATADLYNNMSETIRLQAEIIARLQAGAGAAIATGAPKNFYLDPK